MKKRYVSPFAEVAVFELEAVLSPSNPSGGGFGDEIVDPGSKDNEEAGGKLDLGF